jgi:hypothetical protein
VPASAAAQSTITDIVGFLMTNQAVQTEDFERDRAAAETARDALTRGLLVSLTSVPIATSSGGFVYRLNPELGTVERATESFGGFFVERALTPGHGRAAFGVSGSTSAFDSIDGHSLRDGSFVTIANQFRDEAGPFDTESLTLRIRSSTMTVFASFGISDRFEIGAAVPFLRLTLEGERINVYRGDSIQQAGATAVASGAGDAAIRAKYMLLAARSAGFAVAGEVRLPTGDETNLLGAGRAAVRIMGIGSFERELSGRFLSDLRTITLIGAPHPSYDGVETLRLTSGEAGRYIATGVAGLKWNLAGTMVLAGHLRWNITKTGLTAPLTPSVGIEYAF